MLYFKDLPAAVRRISAFLGRNLSEEVIQKIAEHCSFKTMKGNRMSNFDLVPKELMDSDKSPFLRKGETSLISSSVWSVRISSFLDSSKTFSFGDSCDCLGVSVSGVVGDWKNHFSAEQLARFTTAIHKELENESFSLPWSLD